MPHDPQTPRPSSTLPDELTSIEQEWTQLRSLLLAPEQTQIDQLRERLDHQVVQARDVSRVLPDALAVRGENDPQLATALSPYVEQGFVAAVRKSPQAIVDAIAPIIGPAIRQAITRALQSMTQSLNHTLDESLSLRGLRWRLEAWRTGRPFAEVVLLHKLQYRVEQVFLIHRETGLLLHHVAAESVAVQDHHMVSGMLTAIQNYVQDSFGASQDQTLDHFQVGEWTVWIEQGSRAYLAAVIRGMPPASIRDGFRDVLDRIHAEHADALRGFTGDPAPFALSQSHLEGCLHTHYQAPESPSASKPWILGAVVLIVLAWWGWTAYQAHLKWSNLVDQLRAEPGIVVTVAKSTFSGYQLEGLRDPLAKDPSTLISEAGIDPSTMKAVWSPFYALDPKLITTRAQSMLQPPRTVRLDMDGDTLIATGSASVEWAKETKRLAVLIPGIAHYRDEGLVSISVPDLLTKINQTVVHFSLGSSILEPAELGTLNRVTSLLRDLDHAAFQLGQGVALTIHGSADGTGAEVINRQLSKARAEAVLAALGGEHIGKITTITTRTVAAVTQRASREGSADLRIVSLHATLAPSMRGQEISRP